MVGAEPALPAGEVAPEACGAQLQPGDRLEVARDEREPVRATGGQPLQQRAHARGHESREVVGHQARVVRHGGGAEVAQPGVDRPRVHVAEQEEPAGDVDVGAPGRIEVRGRRLGHAVDVAQRRQDRRGVLGAGLLDERPVDVEEQERHA